MTPKTTKQASPIAGSATTKYEVGKMPPFAEWILSEFEYETQAHVARELGLSRSYVNDLGYARRRLNVKLAVRIERKYPNFNARKILRYELDFNLERQRAKQAK
jgi:plasmid maintenance system antidote protein VapI